MDAVLPFSIGEHVPTPFRLRRAEVSWPRNIGAARQACPVRERKGAELTLPDLDGLLESVAKNRDRAAFKALYDHFAPRLKGFAMRQGSDRQFAEEVVQETMVNVWRKAAQFDPARASAATWVFTIARNMRIDLIRKINRPEPDMDDPSLVPDPEPAAHESISKAQEAARLRAILAELPGEQREVLRLAFFEEKPHGEVAAELGIPLGTVKSRIRLAMKRIRTEFGEDE
jgi:RNA polymerase sigma-70 factor (ECF subfamily)